MSSNITTLDALLAHNQKRLAAFHNHPLFEIIRDDTLGDPCKRDTFLGCVKRFSGNFQTLLFIRQGLCADPLFQAVFLKHMIQEIGHDALLAREHGAGPIQDTLFEAVLGWLNYQMLVLDNTDKVALVHLVIEAAGDHFYGLTASHLGQQGGSGYFEIHVQLDSGHANLGLDLLQGHGQATYERLALVVDGGWDMMGALFDRVRYLVAAAR